MSLLDIENQIDKNILDELGEAYVKMRRELNMKHNISLNEYIYEYGGVVGSIDEEMRMTVDMEIIAMNSFSSKVIQIYRWISKNAGPLETASHIHLEIFRAKIVTPELIIEQILK